MKKTKKSRINWTEQGNLCQLSITRKNIWFRENCNIGYSIETQKDESQTIDKISNRKVFVPGKAIVQQKKTKN